MAHSPSSRHRSRIIREMARDLNRHDYSCASSTGSQHGTVSDDSTISDFDPENEAIMSTRQMDIDLSQKLPQIRDTAKKYGRWNGGRQQDFVINTSAIGRAFPDFSQGGSSDDSMSIEIGRGAKTRQRTPSRAPRAEYSDNIDSPVVTIGDFKITGTPPMKGQAKPTKTEALRNSVRKESHSKRSTPQKENIPPPAPASGTKMPNYVSGATRSASGEQRRSLAEIVAQVADDSDGSFISDERPTVTFANKKSRFSGHQAPIRGSPLASVQNMPKAVNSALIDALSGRRNTSHQTPTRPATATNNSNTVNQTAQSFLLPNIPDISELVSGSFKDGTPVFNNSGKVQSRFASGSSRTPSKVPHNQIDSIPVPDDEKAIFLSLQLLQERVAALEMEKADAQRIASELQRDNYQLQAEKDELERHRRSDSGLGMADSDGEYARNNQKLIAEKTKLEVQLKSLQTRNSETERRATNQELRIKSITVERDQAVMQLAEAYNNNEQLQDENQRLYEEIDQLKQQMSEFLNETTENDRKWKEKEASLRRKLERREQAVTEIREVTREIEFNHKETLRDVKAQKSQQARTKDGNNKQTSNNSRGRVSITAPQQKEDSRRQRSRSRSQVRTVSNNQAKPFQPADFFHDINLDTVKPAVDISDAGDEDAFDDTTKTIHKDLNVRIEDDTRGSNFSSILGHGELDRLREVLAFEKARAKEAREAREAAEAEQEDEQGDDAVRSVRSVRSNRSLRSEGDNTLQRKTSTKGLTGILKTRDQNNDYTGRLSVRSTRSVKSNGQVEQDNTIQSNASHRRRHSENDIQTRKTTIHRRISSDEMTSAFILPDITIHGAMSGGQHPVLTDSARRVLDNLASHNGQNCTVCSRVASFDKKNGTCTHVKQTVQIQKPVPVSERMPVPGPYEDEPTMRPSVAPGLALATVMKGLEDELAHLKMELAQYQAMYNRHDPSLSMRKRKAIKARIESLLKAIDTKADQIYALYDVLEGQKESGQELTEKDVEITLQSIGVDVDTMKKTQHDDDSEDGDSDDSELDLPWEGIEDTTGTASAKGRRQSWGN